MSSLRRLLVNNVCDKLRVFISFRKAKRKSHYTGLLAGILMAFVNLSFAVALRLGGHLVTEKEVTFKDMMKLVKIVAFSNIFYFQTSANFLATLRLPVKSPLVTVSDEVLFDIYTIAVKHFFTFVFY